MRKYLLLLTAAFISLLIGVPVFAVPSLQLYIPGATYYETNPLFPDSEDSWVTFDNPFELQVAGATSPAYVRILTDVKLHIALLENEYILYQSLTTPFLTIQDIEPNPNEVFPTVELYVGDFSLVPGKPDGVAPHGIYPTYYASIDLPDLLVDSALETVYDYNEDFDPDNPELSGSDSGDIQYYRISYDRRFTFIHFDATGTVRNRHIKFVFAPYSHDADTIIPEPITLFLFGTGLLGLAGLGRVRKR